MSMTTTDDTAPLDAKTAQLEEIFRGVQDPTDWRNPICAVIKFENRQAVADAIAFYTGTEAIFENLGAGRLRVRSIGYRNGPCGP